MEDSWFQSWIWLQDNYHWTDFVEDFCAGFGDRNMTDVVEEFNKLRQESFVQQYQMKFEKLRSLMLNLNPYLTEA